MNMNIINVQETRYMKMIRCYAQYRHKQEPSLSYVKMKDCLMHMEYACFVCSLT